MASVRFRLKTPSRKETTIICRFYSKETKALDFSTGEIIPTEYWQGQRVSSKYKKDHDRINRALSNLECQLLDIWRENKGAPAEVLKSLVSQAIKGSGPAVEKKRLTEAVQKFIAQYAQEKESTTVKMYKSILKKLEAFNPELGFEDLDFNFYDAFKKFLYGNPNPVFSGFHVQRDTDNDCLILHPNPIDDSGRVRNLPNVGLFDDTVYKYIVHLKTICGWAEKRGYAVHPSYKEWQIIKRQYPVISLTYHELQAIENLSGLPKHLRIAQDYFSICCRTGQRISDVKRISSLAIASGTWTIHQKKGSRQRQKVVNLPLIDFSSPVIDIVNNYGGKLPEISEQHLNQHIKELCKRAGITQEIYTERWQGNKKIKIPGPKWEFIHLHTGKATFITILGSQGAPLSVLSDFTGTSQKTIEKHYLGHIPLYLAEKYLKITDESPGQLRKAN